MGLKPGELDVLDGSPPCCEFSTAGRGIGDQDVLRHYSDVKQSNIASLPFDLVDLVIRAKPKVFICENVPAFASRGAEVFQRVLRALRFPADGSRAYYADWAVLSASDFGVPQKRQRLFIIGVRKDVGDVVGIDSDEAVRDVFPAPTQVGVTIRSAFADLQQTENDVWPWTRSAMVSSSLAALIRLLPEESDEADAARSRLSRLQEELHADAVFLGQAGSDHGRLGPTPGRADRRDPSGKGSEVHASGIETPHGSAGRLRPHRHVGPSGGARLPDGAAVADQSHRRERLSKKFCYPTRRRPMNVVDFSFKTTPRTSMSTSGRSIPGYRELVRTCVGLSRRFVQPGTTVVDVGCSTGHLLASIQESNQAARPDVNYVGLDCVPDFSDHWGRLENENVRFEVCDARSYQGFKNVSLAYSLFTIQFIRPADKMPLLQRIHDGLVDGGALIIAEKTLADTAAAARRSGVSLLRLQTGAGIQREGHSWTRSAACGDR